MSNMGRPVGNKYKVPKRVWSKWSNHAKGVFNITYHSLRSQNIMTAPHALPMPAKHWNTIRWNAAWLAACAADGIHLVWQR